ncbi:MAG: hypothetical protein JO253_04700 [Alphaproteobacteria bacterium]|nr:hypothetical protein [Alphaproteobacteria bacterium]
MDIEIIDKQESSVAAYAPFYAELVKLEADNAALVFNYETPKGNKEARSHVFSLRKTKGALERVRKEAKAEALRIGRAVDSEANAIEARIEAMILVHQTKLDEIEQREKERVDALQKRLAEIVPNACSTTTEYQAEIGRIQAIEIGADWEEFMAQATTSKNNSLASLDIGLKQSIQRDEEAAELARLRAETAAREQADRDAAIAKAAADKAQREAEEKAAAEKAKVQAALDAAKAETQRKEEAAALAIKQAQEQAKRDAEAAARREMELKLQAEEAERRRIADAEAAERRRVAEAAEAERQRIAAEKRAEEEKQRAIKAEQDRIAAEAKRVADEAAARERNKAHKAKINRDALDSLVAGGLSEEAAKLAVTLIAQGKVDHVTISY